MPWTCPSCHHSIKRDEDEQVPRIGVVYRCHICRLDLVLDPKSHKLIVSTDEDSRGSDEKDRSTP